VRFCKVCGEDIWNEALDAQNLLDAYTQYREKHGLLQPCEIRAIREKYKLSQVAFARVLGLEDKSVTRYENGSIAGIGPNTLIALAYFPKVFKKILELGKSRISTEDYHTASAALDTLTAAKGGKKGE